MNIIVNCYGYLRGRDIKPYTKQESINVVHYNGTAVKTIETATDIMELNDNEHIEIRYRIDEKEYHKVCKGTVDIQQEVQVIDSMNCRKISRLIMRAELLQIESSQLSSEADETEEANVNESVDITHIVHRYSCNDTIDPMVILIEEMRLPEYAKTVNCNVLCITQCVNDDIDTVQYELW